SRTWKASWSMRDRQLTTARSAVTSPGTVPRGLTTRRSRDEEADDAIGGRQRAAGAGRGRPGDRPEARAGFRAAVQRQGPGRLGNHEQGPVLGQGRRYLPGQGQRLAALRERVQGFR